MIRRLADIRLPSFAGEALDLTSATELFGMVRAIKKFSSARNYDTMLYVGPFEGNEAAIAAAPALCSVLEEMGEMSSKCDEIVTRHEGNSLYMRGSFDVSAVRVAAASK
jgi:hypothetical protein